MELIAERKSGKIYKGDPWCFYEVKQPVLTEKERELVSLIGKATLDEVSPSDLAMLFIENKQRAGFVEKARDLLSQLAPYYDRLLDEKEEAKAIKMVGEFVTKVAPFVVHKEQVIYSIIKNLIGLGRLSYLSDDDELEEIMINGAKQPVFVFDRTYGLCKSSISFDDDREIIAIINRVARFTVKKVSKDMPLLEARLPDGSRINATIPPASPKGPTITIRKFRKRPFTITDIVKNNTMTSEVAAFLWMCVDGMHSVPRNIIIAGGTGSGKTTTLNALSVFVPQRERIVTIEDTLELNLHGRENWIQLEARPGIYEAPLTMDDLLKNTIRMRPDRIIVGEVRGSEAEMMFVAMDIGHQGVMSTIHSNSARESLLRLQSAPMNVPKSMFTLLDLIVMQHRMYIPKTGTIRRVTQLAEVSVMDEHILLNDIYMRDRNKDEVTRTEIPSQTVELFAFYTGMTKMEIQEELLSRQLVIDFLVDNNITEVSDIQKIISAYQSNPKGVLDKIQSKKLT